MALYGRHCRDNDTALLNATDVSTCCGARYAIRLNEDVSFADWCLVPSQTLPFALPLPTFHFPIVSWLVRVVPSLPAITATALSVAS